MFVLALIPALLGILVGWGGLLGRRGKLPRDRGAGVRTWATLRSDEAFRVANRIAALPTMTAGGVGLLASVAALLMPSTMGMMTAVAIGLISMFALVAGGGLLGHRAAEAIPPADRAPSCGGCACSGGGCTALSGSTESTESSS